MARNMSTPSRNFFWGQYPLDMRACDNYSCHMDEIDYARIADELAQHMNDLVRLMADPFRNAAAIEQRRQLAVECAEALSAYLVGSADFPGL